LYHRVAQLFIAVHRISAEIAGR